MNKPLEIRQLRLGPMANFIYIVFCPTTREAICIDPAWDSKFIVDEIESNDLTVTGIFLTHEHHDHVNAVADLLGYYSVPIYASAYSTYSDFPFEGLTNQSTLQLGNLQLTVYLTPGHSPGGMCIYSEPHLFTGDTLFVDGCGRCDLVGSDVHEMYNSLFNIISSFPNSTIVYPGHDYGPKPSDTLRNQYQKNRFFQSNSKSTFIRKRLGFST